MQGGSKTISLFIIINSIFRSLTAITQTIITKLPGKSSKRFCGVSPQKNEKSPLFPPGLRRKGENVLWKAPEIFRQTGKKAKNRFCPGQRRNLGTVPQIIPSQNGSALWLSKSGTEAILLTSKLTYQSPWDKIILWQPVIYESETGFSAPNR